MVPVSFSFARYRDVQVLNLLLTKALRRGHLVSDRRGLDRKVKGTPWIGSHGLCPPRLFLPDHVVAVKDLTSTSPSERKDARSP